MADNEKKALSNAPEPPTIRSGEYKIIFSNFSRMRVSPTEFAIRFGYLDTTPLPGSPMNSGMNIDAVEDRVAVVLTPHHAKILALTLQGSVTAYEREYGKIDITPRPTIGADKLMSAINELIERSSGD
jgi:hypothetical protein